MRSRHPTIWWPSQAAEPTQEPIPISWYKNNRWMNRVRTWNWTAFIQLTSDGTVLYNFADVEVGWNYTNSAAAIWTPSIPMIPSHEQWLPLGWQIQVTQSSGGASVDDAALSFYFETSQPGFGCRYDSVDDDVFPRLKMVFGGTQSTDGDSVSWFSGIDGDVDDEYLNFTSDFANQYSGYVTLYPKTYWAYKKENGTNAIWDASSGDLLIPGRQVDELP